MKEIKNVLNQLETILDEYFGKKAPQLPENIKEILVKLAPYLAILGIIISVPALFVLLGLGGIATALAPMGGASVFAAIPTMWLSTLLLVPIIILEALAIPGLFANKSIAWRYMFYAELISLLSGVLSGQIINTLIGTAIGIYILFQIKSYYK